jgi:hypothetical protein
MERQFKESFREHMDISDQSDNATTSTARLQSEGDLTKETHDTYTLSCDCGTPLLRVLDPEYDLIVGIDHAVPVELCWTSCEWDVQSDDQPSDLELLSENMAVLTCSNCGSKEVIPFGQQGGLFVPIDQCDHQQTPIPRDRLRYRTHPEHSWNAVNLKRLGSK